MHKREGLLTVQAAGKSLELLELLLVGGERLRIGELAARLEVSRKEALLFLVTLESRGIVRWDDQARVYRPGEKPLELVRHFFAMSGMPAIEVAVRPVTARAGVKRKLSPARHLAATATC